MTTKERLEKYLMASPKIAESAYVSPDAVVIGDVTVGEKSSVWPGVVLRADINSIKIGEGSNIQDGTMVHLADDYGVNVGDYTTVGHGAILHACDIGNETLIGMGATILDGAKIGNQCVIGACSLVTKGTVIPDGSVVMGVPGKIVKTMDMKARARIRDWATKYLEVAQAHKQIFGNLDTEGKGHCHCHAHGEGEGECCHHHEGEKSDHECCHHRHEHEGGEHKCRCRER